MAARFGPENKFRAISIRSGHHGRRQAATKAHRVTHQTGIGDYSPILYRILYRIGFCPVSRRPIGDDGGLSQPGSR